MAKIKVRDSTFSLSFGHLYLLVPEDGKSLELYEGGWTSDYGSEGDRTHWGTSLINLLDYDISHKTEKGIISKKDFFELSYKPVIPISSGNERIDSLGTCNKQAFVWLRYEDPFREGIRVHFNDMDVKFDKIKQFIDTHIEMYRPEAYVDGAKVVWDGFHKNLVQGRSSLRMLKEHLQGPFFDGCGEVFEGIEETRPALIESGTRTIRRDGRLPEDFVRKIINEMDDYLAKARPLGIRPEIKLSVDLQPLRAQTANLIQTAEQYRRSADQGGFVPEDVLSEFDRMQASVSSWAARLKSTSPADLIDQYSAIEEDLIKVKRAADYVKRRMGYLKEE